VSAFQVKPGHAFKQRVTDSKGNAGIFSTGTSDVETKDAVVAMLKRLRKQRRWDVLDAIVGKRAKLKAVFDADQRGELDEFMASLNDVDLSVLVAEWEANGASARYVSHVRRLIPEGVVFPASHFRRKAISSHLANLQDMRAHRRKRIASNSTKNRHRASFFQFAKWLIEREAIDSNPVRDVAGREENPPREVWYPWKDAQAIVNALPEPYRSLEALMAGSGMEWSAAMNAKRSDVNTETRFIFARGSKNKHRVRWVKVTEPWAWSIVEAHIRNLTPNAPLFSGITEKTALAVHRDALKALGLPDSTLHDWRHTYAVNNLRSKKLKREVIRRQLGHAKNSTVLEKVYAVWIVDESDYETASDSTISATTPEKQHEVKLAK
jgi:integrase